jgi:hypothetical protein
MEVRSQLLKSAHRPAGNPTRQSYLNDAVNNPGTGATDLQVENNNEPKILIISNSQMDRLNKDKVRGYQMMKCKVPTIQQADAEAAALVSGKDPKAIIVHLITNDVKTKKPGEVVKDLKALVTKIKSISNVPVLISLGIPVFDYDIDKKIELVNLILSSDKSLTTIQHDDSFITSGMAIESLYLDNFHPNQEGLKRIIVNFKKALGSTL